MLVVVSTSALLVVVAVSWQAAQTKFVDLAGHCGDDGARYCAMAKGSRVEEPFKMRILTPLIVRVTAPLGGTVVDRFLVVNVIAILLLMGLCGALAASLAVAVGCGRDRAITAGSVTAALCALNPWTWHFVLSYPALTDVVALTIGLGWAAAFTARGDRWYAVPLAALAVLAREAWLLPILVTLVVAGRLYRRSRVFLVVNGVAAVAAYVAVFLAPSLESDYSAFGELKQSLRANFTSGSGVLKLGWLVVFGLGFVWLCLCARGSKVVRHERAVVLLLLAGLHFGLALVGGGDTDRLLLPSAMILSVVALARVAEDPRLDPLTGLLVAATVLIWRPWHIVTPDVPGFWAFWGARDLTATQLVHRIMSDALLLVVPALGMLGWLVRHRQSGHAGRARGGSL